MKILLANKFYYRRGGDCIYMLNLEQLLKAHGHEVAVFAMQYPKNLPSEWSKYWPSQMTALKAFTRPFGVKEVREKFSALLDDFKPEVVHLNNIHTQLSPVIAEIAHQRGIRVVWTLHDTKLVCPAYTCQRGGKWCDECFSDKKAVLKHRCLPGNIVGAYIGWWEILKWNKERLEACTDLFLPPSKFLMDTMVRGGYSQKKFRPFCNFIDVSKVKGKEPSQKEDYYAFLGRIDDYKGVLTLCKAANQLSYKLKVIGGGPLLNVLRETYKDHPHLEFLGQRTWEELAPILAHAKFMVLPSECSENNPLTVIEAQSLGTPVLGARIGGIPELIKSLTPSLSPKGESSKIDGEDMVPNGMTFESGNVEDLKKMIQMMWDASWDYEAIAQQAQERYSSEAYYEQLMKYYQTKVL